MRRHGGRSHYGLARTFVVARDLLALPRIQRAAGGPPIGVVVALGGIVALAVAVFPLRIAEPVIVAAFVVAAATAWAIAYNVRRVARARASGVFRVREVV
jgi:hypothetical protein